ncbi:LysR substrate-binding domain-containing protein [Xylophilus sp. GOD-11R]|uniref:LysR substrate-binding domain-containing protein n=1 Tax=Xylophilus sp. GOD-11R TaxID=3089814 RepID=UPI00298C704B|nr:LysR substrate-binding domain-containing protein [Xylophilus sp. GOD-11R]WPB56630.1 LysR substrate-binding domain-containing protein [Xylophilus sp. GOD-11R]
MLWPRIVINQPPHAEPSLPATDDLRVFVVLARKASFVAAATELGVSRAYVSKRLQVLEQTLGVRLLHRTTRQVTVTEDGERIYQWAQRIVEDVQQLVQEMDASRSVPRGTLRISSSFGFGRRVVAPMLSSLVARYPALQVRLEVYDRLVDVAAEGVDLDIRIGDEIAPHLIARPLAANHRLLCAAPDYLARRGTPRSLQDLAAHDCIVIKERDHPFGTWTLQGPGRTQDVKVSGPLSSNHGEIAVQWALDGRGIVLRSRWDVQPLIDDGRLRQVLPEYRQDAGIWAVYPQRLASSAKVRVCVEFLQQAFAHEAPFVAPD